MWAFTSTSLHAAMLDLAADIPPSELEAIS